ncbi:MAG TPA: hypothetical protein VIJ36_13270 [Thermoanaerobaculia bacterium]
MRMKHPALLLLLLPPALLALAARAADRLIAGARSGLAHEIAQGVSS